MADLIIPPSLPVLSLQVSKFKQGNKVGIVQAEVDTLEMR